MKNDNKETLREQIAAIRQQSIPSDNHREYWTKENQELLKQMYFEGVGISEMAVLLKRSERAIINQIESTGLTKKTCAPEKYKTECPQCSHYKTMIISVSTPVNNRYLLKYVKTCD